MKTFKINLNPVFAVCATLDECKAQALNLQEQIKAAYAVRAKEINAAAQDEVTVEAVAEEEAPAPAPAIANPKQKSSMAVTPHLDPIPKAGKKAKKDPKEIAKAMKAEKKEAAPKAGKKAEQVTQISITDKEAIKALNLEWVKYSEKSYALKGDTKALAKYLEDKKGRFNRALKEGGKDSTSENKFAGWIFANKHAEIVAKELGIAI